MRAKPRTGADPNGRRGRIRQPAEFASRPGVRIY